MGQSTMPSSMGRTNSKSALAAVTPLQQWKCHIHILNRKNLQLTASVRLALYSQLTSTTIHQGHHQLDKSNRNSIDLFKF
jgi:hypothetical protein